MADVQLRPGSSSPYLIGIPPKSSAPDAPASGAPASSAIPYAPDIGQAGQKHVAPTNGTTILGLRAGGSSVEVRAPDLEASKRALFEGFVNADKGLETARKLDLRAMFDSGDADAQALVRAAGRAWLERSPSDVPRWLVQAVWSTGEHADQQRVFALAHTARAHFAGESALLPRQPPTRAPTALTS